MLVWETSEVVRVRNFGGTIEALSSPDRTELCRERLALEDGKYDDNTLRVELEDSRLRAFS